MSRKLGIVAAVVGFVMAASAGNTAFAGPVIIGGDDLTDHGFNVAGVNMEGWKYIELALKDLEAGQTRVGSFDADIIALGSSLSTDPGDGITEGNAGAAMHFATTALGLSVIYIDTGASITQFFLDLDGGTINAGVIWIAGTRAANDLDSAESAALLAGASQLDGFVTSGGGLMSHGTDYDWLTALIPGIITTGGCSSSGATLTAAGNATFPGLTDSDIDANAGPCHNTFSGSLGGLGVLAHDGTGRNMIIGGEVTAEGGGIGGRVPEPGILGLFGFGLVALGIARRRRLA